MTSIPTVHPGRCWRLRDRRAGFPNPALFLL